ncbi:MAG: phytanoyl-CoA dioxygenase family protein [Chloroflexi bacterium]|nr:phytanoyl-CoA dioxygenase family protein [Chloroflexota bacterium]
MSHGQPTRQSLLEDGFSVFPQVLDREMVQDLTRATEALLAAYPAEDAAKFRYQGSNIRLAFQDPVFPRLFAWPKALAALSELGFDDPRWWSAFLLSKPPHAPPLYWHQDWWAWDDPVSQNDIPAQVFLMYYLTDTTPENGCLRVIPGTHRRRVPLHEQLPAAHSDETYDAKLDAASPLFAESIRSFAAKSATVPPPGFQNQPEFAALVRLIPEYSGEARPPVWNRIPGQYLRE